MSDKRLKELAKFLRSEVPVSCPVYVRRNKFLSGDLGATTFNGRSFTIRIAKDATWQEQVDTLQHEWAHAVAIDRAFHHNDAWGIAFAEVYRKSYD